MSSSMLERLLPTHTNKFSSRRNAARFAEELKKRFERPTILVVGAGSGGPGPGIDVLVTDPLFRIVNSDKNPTNPSYIDADAHNLPFPDSSFDGLVIQTVLEHVFDPYRCVGEIHRVLRPGGIVYSVTPFMQQVHGAEFDFTRFTFLGHRRLFRDFAEIDSGITAGPGSSLAWAWEYFWLAIFSSRRGLFRRIIRGLSRVSMFWAPLLDPWISKRIGAYDAASELYFIGSRADVPLPDDELLKQFRGVR
jgi:SAM-dependent methyltransferase